MQENRSFDHYFGSLQGVRGFADKQALKYQNGTSIFQQPDTKRTDGGLLLPFHMDSTKVNAQNAADLDHSWTGDHSARNGGLWNNYMPPRPSRRWVTSPGPTSRSSTPWPTRSPSATVTTRRSGPDQPEPDVPLDRHERRLITNPADYAAVFKGAKPLLPIPSNCKPPASPGRSTPTMRSGTAAANAWVGDFGDNPLWFYQQYEDSQNTTTAAGQELAIRGPSSPGSQRRAAARPERRQPRAGPVRRRRDSRDAAAGLVDRGARQLHRAPGGEPELRRALHQDSARGADGKQVLWNSTALFITFDEHDGYFDHMVPPAPDASVTNEFIGGLPIGFGNRVPMIICSPWTRGGFVDSNTYNHTSMLQFLETWTGARALNVTDWRRSISGDLTAAFDFENPDFSIPNLPDTVPLITQSDAEKAFPKVATPPEGQQTFPVQEAGTRPHRPPTNMTLADVTVNRTSGLVTAKLLGPREGRRLAGRLPRQLRAAAATQFTVTRGHDQHYTWDTTLTGGNYAFSVYGPDGFLSSFAGAVVPASQTKGKVPKITARQRNGHKGILVLTLENDGHEPVTYSLTPGDYSGQAQSAGVARGHKQTIDWPANADGYYDVTVTADSGDGFLRRYAAASSSQQAPGARGNSAPGTRFASGGLGSKPPQSFLTNIFGIKFCVR